MTNGESEEARAVRRVDGCVVTCLDVRNSDWALRQFMDEHYPANVAGMRWYARVAVMLGRLQEREVERVSGLCRRQGETERRLRLEDTESESIASGEIDLRAVGGVA